jgi:hypothetical protein
VVVDDCDPAGCWLGSEDSIAAVLAHERLIGATRKASVTSVHPYNGDRCDFGQQQQDLLVLESKCDDAEKNESVSAFLSNLETAINIKKIANTPQLLTNFTVQIGSIGNSHN